MARLSIASSTHARQYALSQHEWIRLKEVLSKVKVAAKGHLVLLDLGRYTPAPQLTELGDEEPLILFHVPSALKLVKRTGRIQIDCVHKLGQVSRRFSIFSVVARDLETFRTVTWALAITCGEGEKVTKKILRSLMGSDGETGQCRPIEPCKHGFTYGDLEPPHRGFGLVPCAKCPASTSSPRRQHSSRKLTVTVDTQRETRHAVLDAGCHLSTSNFHIVKGLTDTLDVCGVSDVSTRAAILVAFKCTVRVAPVSSSILSSRVELNHRRRLLKECFVMLGLSVEQQLMISEYLDGLFDGACVGGSREVVDVAGEDIGGCIFDRNTGGAEWGHQNLLKVLTSNGSTEKTLTITEVVSQIIGVDLGKEIKNGLGVRDEDGDEHDQFWEEDDENDYENEQDVDQDDEDAVVNRTNSNKREDDEDEEEDVNYDEEVEDNHREVEAIEEEDGEEDGEHAVWNVNLDDDEEDEYEEGGADEKTDESERFATYIAKRKRSQSQTGRLAKRKRDHGGVGIIQFQNILSSVTGPPKPPAGKAREDNQARFLFLSGKVFQSDINPDIFYCERNALYEDTEHLGNLFKPWSYAEHTDESVLEAVKPLRARCSNWIASFALVFHDGILYEENKQFFKVNVSTNECDCLFSLWRAPGIGSTSNVGVCKHVLASRLKLEADNVSTREGVDDNSQLFNDELATFGRYIRHLARTSVHLNLALLLFDEQDNKKILDHISREYERIGDKSPPEASYVSLKSFAMPKGKVKRRKPNHSNDDDSTTADEPANNDQSASIEDLVGRLDRENLERLVVATLASSAVSTAEFHEPKMGLWAPVPFEIQLRILGGLEVRDKIQVLKVCKGWRSLKNIKDFWARFELKPDYRGPLKEPSKEATTEFSGFVRTFLPANSVRSINWSSDAGIANDDLKTLLQSAAVNEPTNATPHTRYVRKKISDRMAEVFVEEMRNARIVPEQSTLVELSLHGKKLTSAHLQVAAKFCAANLRRLELKRFNAKVRNDAILGLIAKAPKLEMVEVDFDGFSEDFLRQLAFASAPLRRGGEYSRPVITRLCIHPSWSPIDAATLYHFGDLLPELVWSE
ncbi:hypothetical protein HK102_008882 [Quaeritorhiza haematococci]|nr:hypothetical protein HK102_008882 [Quaeritorhiza haematococci]